MKYNPQIHHRKSIRLKNYDYSQQGAYFITICTQNRECLFDLYPSLRIIVETEWQNIPSEFPCIELDEYIIMPNHIHGILFIVGAGLAPAPNQNRNRATARVAPTVGTIIGKYKSRCVHQWLSYIKQNNLNAPGKFWQRNYYEHIIRNEHSLNKIREYIINNPLQWELDFENPDRKKEYKDLTSYFKEKIK